MSTEITFFLEVYNTAFPGENKDVYHPEEVRSVKLEKDSMVFCYFVRNYKFFIFTLHFRAKLL